MVRFSILLPLLLTLGCSCQTEKPQAAVAANGVSPEELDELFGESLLQWQVPGLAVAVVNDREILHLKGYGQKDLQRKEPMTSDTIVPIASCTKAFTTTLLAMMADDGRLDWDDSVRKHFGSFRLSDPHANGMVTLRDLCSHRTGVSGHDLLWYHSPWSWEEILSRSAYLPVNAPFRSRFQYNSIMFVAAAHAAEAGLKDDWANLVRRRICEPLEIAPVAFTSAEVEQIADRATGYRLGEDGQIRLMPAYEFREPSPAGSLFTSANGLAHWTQFQLGQGSYQGHQLLSRQSYRELVTPQMVMPTDGEFADTYPASKLVSYGLGWVIFDYRGEKVVAHGGQLDGFRVQITFLPERNLGFVLVNNLHETKMNLALTNLLIDRYLKLDAKDWHKHFRSIVEKEKAELSANRAEWDQLRANAMPPGFPLEQYAGRYENPAYGQVEVRLEQGRLHWKWSSFDVPMRHITEESFQLSGSVLQDVMATFQPDDRKVIGLTAFGQRFRRSQVKE